MADPQKYRDEAKRLLHEAEQLKDASVKRQMRAIADQYEELAEIVAATVATELRTFRAAGRALPRLAGWPVSHGGGGADPGIGHLPRSVA